MTITLTLLLFSPVEDEIPEKPLEQMCKGIIEDAKRMMQEISVKTFETVNKFAIKAVSMNGVGQESVIESELVTIHTKM